MITPQSQILYNISTDPSFLQRVEMASLEVAGMVSAQPYGTPNRVNRLNLATQVFNNSAGYAVRFAKIAAAGQPSNVAQASDVSDTTLIQMLMDEWDGVAGDKGFEDRVKFSATRLAVGIIQSTPSTGATAAQLKSATIAYKYLLSSDSFLPSILTSVAVAFTTISPTDAQLDAVLSQQFAQYAANPATS